MAGVSSGNYLWSAESRVGPSANSVWSSILLQTTEMQATLPCSSTSALSEMGNLADWPSADVCDMTPNSACDVNVVAGSIPTVSSDLNMAFTNLGRPELGDSASLLDPTAQMGAFATALHDQSHVWSQAMLNRGGESMQNAVESFQEVLYSRQNGSPQKLKELEDVSAGWELRNFTAFQGEDTSCFSTAAKENSYGPLHNCNNSLIDLGSSPSLQPDGLTPGHVPINSFNSRLDLPIPHFDIGRVKQEFNMSYDNPGLDAPRTLVSQGFRSDPCSNEELLRILDFPLNQPFLKGATAHGFHNATSMRGEDHHQQPHGLWPTSNTYSSRTFPAALSRLLPSSPLKQPASRLLTNSRNIPLWNSMASTPEKMQQSTNSTDRASSLQYCSPQFLQEGKQLNNTTQSLNMPRCDEARDATNDAKRSSPDSSSSDSIFKRPRLDNTNSTLPTFKVRKEKLGDRITALQQLVSPFGKTDTASVLWEAIVYIKSLHEQVQKLSMPYMNKGAVNSAQGVNLQAHDQMDWSVSSEAEDTDEPKQDLRSRGLCLVPVSSTLSVAYNDSSADYWTPTFICSYR